uniref:Uncharacterized protein n=1 Tax=Molossus molossus TaxID=27622 RepID=A0A7J8FS88_MOLMO|nr:hypothetical protein HJG59_008384 [Molossus molossus]
MLEADSRIQLSSAQRMLGVTRVAEMLQTDASYRKSSWQAWKSILRADMPGTFDSTSFTQEKQPQRTRSSLCCGLGKSFGSSGSQFSLLLRQYCKENDFMLRQIPECTSGTWQLRMKCLDLRGHISFLSHYCGLSSWLVW